MILKSFGCSFLDGTELVSVDNSWPAIIAGKLDIKHENRAQGGMGNLQILDRILKNSTPNSFYIVNWTWIDRFDFCSSETETWETLRPSLDHKHAPYYFRYLHGQYVDMLTSLIYIRTAIEHLQEHNIPFIMTCMDPNIFEPVSDHWQDSRAVRKLQNFIQPYVKSFEGDNFLQWSKKHNFAISSTLHPLDQAHQAAAEYWLPYIKEML